MKERNLLKNVHVVARKKRRRSGGGGSLNMVPWYASTYKKNDEKGRILSQIGGVPGPPKGGYLTEDTLVTLIKGVLCKEYLHTDIQYTFSMNQRSFSWDCFRILPCLQFILRV